ncbi:aurora kinase A-interacting protein [Nematolebias whitei]|uniref:aurora kinase A-interacting protein n=1 Tax=Nematolebias whitei TaxID=451745 RepID=UPI001896F029|nr:aurora kinase A-interacting protein [Nematolebias whitei]
MFALKIVTRFSHLSRATCALHAHGGILNGSIQAAVTASCSSLQQKLRNYATAADNASPPRWVQLEPELEEALIPRKLSMSPLESWLSLRYTLPSPLESPQPQEDVELLEEKVLPPVFLPVLDDTGGSATPIKCKNVLEIRRRKMNRHKFRKLQKRIKFVKRKVRYGKGTRKQKRFEKDLERIWKRAGLKQPPAGWVPPKLFIRQHRTKKN